MTFIRRGRDDQVSLDSVLSPGRFHSGLIEDGRIRSAERDEKLENPERAYLRQATEKRAGVYVPIPLYRVPSANTLALANDIDQVRWLQVVAYTLINGAVDVPLIDSEGFPLVSPAIPPMVVLRIRSESAATDRVGAPFPSALDWTDRCTNIVRSDIGDDTLFNNVVIARYELRQESSPRDHWVLRLISDQFDNGSSPYVAMNFLAHVLSEGGGIPGRPGTGGIPTYPNDADPSPLPIEVGSAGASGHYKLWKPYARHPHLATPDQEGLRRHVIANGERYIQAGFTATVYLNSPNALSGDTKVFESPATALGIGPAVLMFGDRDAQQNRGNVQTSWLADTDGRGHPFAGYPNPPIHNQADGRAFYSNLRWGGTNWVLNIYNEGTVVGNDDRNYYWWSFGYRYGV